MAKYLYRPHRGGLDDAMKELREFNSKKEMLTYVYENESFGDEKSIKDLTCSYYRDSDFRIGWKKFYVVQSKGRSGCGWFTKNLSKEASLIIYNQWLNEYSRTKDAEENSDSEEQERNKREEEVIEKEKQNFPEQIEIIKRIFNEDLAIKVKTEHLECIAKQIVGPNQKDFFERIDQRYICELNIRMQSGEPRLVIDVTDVDKLLWHEEHMPGVTFFPEILLLEDYGKTWWIAE